MLSSGLAGKILSIGPNDDPLPLPQQDLENSHLLNHALPFPFTRVLFYRPSS